jgi:hypothetical protein
LKNKTTVNPLETNFGRGATGNIRHSKRLHQLKKKEKKETLMRFEKDPSAEKTMKKRIMQILMPLSKILNLVPTDMVLDNLAFKIDDSKKTNINFQNYV